MCKSSDRQGTLSGPSQLVLLIPPLRLIKKLVKKTSPHVVRTWSKDTKAITSISNGFRSGHKSWDGTISWVWWSMIPLHWQHTLSLARSHYPWNSAHASNQTAFGDIREKSHGLCVFCSYQFALNAWTKEREKNESRLCHSTWHSLAFFFLWFKYCTPYMAVIFTYSNYVILFGGFPAL